MTKCQNDHPGILKSGTIQIGPRHRQDNHQLHTMCRLLDHRQHHGRKPPPKMASSLEAEHVQDVVLLQVSRLIGKTEKCSEKFALVAIIDVRERIAHLTTTLDLVYKVELEVWVMSL